MESRLRALREVDQQLERLAHQLNASRPDLYRELALYCQVLRKGLPASVQQACFTLVTRYAESGYGSLPSQQRQDLHRRLTTLVQRCSSLLTVEQLAVLGGQLARQRRRRRDDSALELRERLMPDQEPEPEPAEPLPPGSVRLALTPPLTADLFAGDLPLPSLPAEQRQPPADLPVPEQLQSLLAFSLTEEPSAPRPTPGGSLLPQDPLALLAWWEQLEVALQRRLRNLSHAINMELLRLGLSRTLLPVHLLDAVLKAQIDALPAPANLLRLPLPLPTPESEPPREVVGLLLRCSDLEYEQPRLRTCRLQLRRRHQELRRMAQQFRHWQRRAQVLEAEQLWLQDSGAKGPQPPQA